MEAGIVIAVIGALLVVAVPVTGHLYRKHQCHKTHFSTIWKRSSDLIPEDVLGIRAKDKLNFNRAYLERPDVDLPLREILEKGDCVLIIGNPLAGKTRAVYEALKKMPNQASVLIPRPEDIRPGEFEIPNRGKFLSNPIILFDDIDKFACKQNFEFLFNMFVQHEAVIVATCRKGIEYDNFCSGHDSILQVFNHTIEIPKVGIEAAEDFAAKNNIESVSNFDGNIGSFFVHIDAMKERYAKCSSNQKGVLAAIKRLYKAGIYQGHEEFTIDRIKLVGEKCEEVSLNKHDSQDLFQRLTENGFVDKNGCTIRAEETYIQKVIRVDFDLVGNFEELKNIFADDPTALIMLGNRANDIAQYDIQRSDLERIAIEAYNEALKTYTPDKYPIDYGITQNNLGAAYNTLAEIEDNAANAKKAINAFNKALEVYTPDKSPMDYGMTRNNLGNAYRILAEIEGSAACAYKAVAAYNESLKVWTEDKYPADYAMTQNNLGAAYTTLSQIEDKAANAHKAITAYNETFKVYTPDKYPYNYAMTQNNLGAAYRTLAEVEDHGDNAHKAIAAFNEALKIRTAGKYPFDYGVTKNNLGSAYSTLAKLEDNPAVIRQAIAAFNEALKVRTLEKFPVQHANTQNNLGVAYKTLAELEDKPANLKNAIAHYSIALDMLDKNNYSIQFADYSYNLGLAYVHLADIEERSSNLSSAENIFKTALDIYKTFGISAEASDCQRILDYLEQLKNNI